MLLLSSVPPPYGGLTVHTARLRATLERVGWDAEVLSPPAVPHAPGARLRTARTLRRQVAFFLRVARTDCDLIHDHISTYAVGVPGIRSVLLHGALLLAIRASRKPWIVSSGTGLLPGLVARCSRLATAWYRALYAAVRFGIAKNQPILDALVALGLGDRSRIVGTFLEPERRSGQSALAPDEEKFLAEHPVSLVTAGFRFEPLYHLDAVVRAAAAVRAARPAAAPAVGVIVLGSHAEDPAGKPALDAAIAETGMGPHTLVLRDVDYALDVIARSAVFVRATDVDGDANTVKEAMWVGVPVLATDLPGRPPGIELVSPKALDTLGRRLQAMLAQPDPDRIRRNQAFVVDDIARNAATIVGLYEEALR